MSAHDPTDLAAQDAQTERDSTVSVERRRRELDDLRWVMGHAQGRRVLQRLFEQTGVYRSSWNHSGSVMAFNEGRRDIGLWLTAECTEASMDAYLKLLREFQGK